jgi:hypothetical protein
MAKVRYQLPDPPNFQGWGLILLISCILLPLNSHMIALNWGLFKILLPERWQSPQFEQILMFLIPIILLLIELRCLHWLFLWLPPRRTES